MSQSTHDPDFVYVGAGDKVTIPWAEAIKMGEKIYDETGRRPYAIALEDFVADPMQPGVFRGRMEILPPAAPAWGGIDSDYEQWVADGRPSGKVMSMSFDDYDAFAATTSRFDPRWGILYPAMGLAGEAGETLEQIKKWMRDDKPGGVGDKPDAERQLRIIREMGDVLWYLSSLAQMLGTSLDEVARENVRKLTLRRSKGMLHGEGSDREQA